MKLKIYEVGIMSDVRKVEAPDAQAAALYYGMHTRGNMQFYAAVFKENGKPLVGDKFPALTLRDKTKFTEAEKVDLQRRLEECRFIDN